MTAEEYYNSRTMRIGNKRAHFSLLAQIKGIGLSEELRDLHIKINARHRRKKTEIIQEIRRKYYEENKVNNSITNRYEFDIMLKHSNNISKLLKNIKDRI